MTQPQRYVPPSWNAVTQLCAVLAAADGHERSDVEIQLWLDVAVEGRWRPDELKRAVARTARTWQGGFSGSARILPGTIDAVIRADRVQPAPFVPLPPVDDATAQHRRAAIDAFVKAQVARTALESAAFDPGETLEKVVAGHARAAYRGIDWAAVDGCDECDERGIRLDARDVVCEHPARNRRGAVVQSGAHTHHEGPTEGDGDHGEQRVGADTPAAAGDGQRGAAADGGGAGGDPAVDGAG